MIKLRDLLNEAKNDDKYVVIAFHEKGGGFVMTRPSSKKDAEDSARSIRKTSDITQQKAVKVSDARNIRYLVGKEYLNEELVNENLRSGDVSKLQKGLERILGTNVNYDINSNDAYEFYIDNAEFYIGVGDGEELGTKFAFDIYNDGATKTLASGTSDNLNDIIKQVLAAARKYKKSLLQTESVNEEFTAVSNKSGKTVVFKNKDARDAAVKAGTHEVPEDENGGKDEPKGDKPNMFSKDAGYDAPDAKSSKPKKSDTPKVQPRKVGKKLEAKVDKISAKLGLDPKKLGKEEYEKRMLSLVHDVLEDANFHGENRAIFAHLMGNPKLAQEPDYSKAPEFGSPEYEKWKDENTIYGSGFKNMTSEFDGVNSAATSITGETGWNGQLSLDAILNKMRKDGSGELADKIQAAFDKTQNESKSTKLTDLI